MANVRDAIKMTPEEVDAFLHERHSMSVATIGAEGRPHVVAMWYGFVDGAPAFETYRKSQKVVNLRRDPRMTCLVEDGDSYENLRGVELIATGTIVEDKEALATVARSLFERYNTGFGPDQGALGVPGRVGGASGRESQVSHFHGCEPDQRIRIVAIVTATRGIGMRIAVIIPESARLARAGLTRVPHRACISILTS